MQLKSLKSTDLKNKTVIVRVDYNVPLDNKGEIYDDTRIIQSIPTIKYLLDQNTKIILVSHLGRPEGKAVDNLRLEITARKLSRLLNEQVLALHDCRGEEVERAVEGMEFQDIIMLENLRFCPEEEKNDSEFARQLANLADVFINDAFGTIHRSHASTEGITHFLPSYAGLLLEKEINALDQTINNPERPYIAIIGGAKISTKIKLIKKLADKVDYLLLGGALANTVCKAMGHKIGKSMIESNMLRVVADIKSQINNKIKIPRDVVLGKDGVNQEDFRIANLDQINSEEAIFDIGPETIKEYSQVIKEAKTIIWNGPMGKYEVVQYAGGTNAIARAVAGSSGKSIIGGGETLEAVSRLDLINRIYFVSTGGGAMLKYIEGEKMPALEALKK